MVTLVVVSCGLLSALPPESDAGGPAPDLASYEAAYDDARAKVGRDADAHVRLALWCEAHGLPAERLKHLAIAALIEPGHATARGLMGLVAHAGGWKRPEAVADLLKADAELGATLEQYRARRDRTPVKAEDQWKLALWCEEHGLEAEAKAHLTIVTRIDPDHAAARKRLGYRKQGGRWVTDAQLAEEKAEAELQKKADRAWKPRLEKYRAMLAARDEAKRAEAKRALLEVTDPRAVPAVFAAFGIGSAARQVIAVQLLGQIDGPVSSRALVTLAVFSPAAEVRQTAIQTLSRRDPRDFVGMLVKQLRDPIEYEVRPVEGPGSPGVLYVEGEKFDARRFYGTPAMHPSAGPQPVVQLGNLTGTGSPSFLGIPPIRRPMELNVTPQDVRDIASNLQNAPAILSRNAVDPVAILQKGNTAGLPAAGPRVIRSGAGNYYDLVEYSLFYEMQAAQRAYEVGLVERDIQRATLDAQQRLSNDLRALERINSAIHRQNDRILPVLEGTTNRRFGEDRSAWQVWWTDQEGYTIATAGRTYKPVVDQFIEIPFQPIPMTPLFILPDPNMYSCFGAGTQVRTREGQASIESVKVGDQVLAQDVRTGALSYKPVLAVFHNPPTAPLKVSFGHEAIVATGVHRFWKAGHGWVMARDLKVGDTLRTLGGVARVAAIEPQESQPVFNLEVAGPNTFFAGEQGALVHDNNLVRSSPEPFDAAPELEAVAPSPAPR